MRLDLISLFTLVLTSHPAFGNPAIIGGKIVSDRDFIAHSVVALIGRSNRGEALCTASIVAKDLALTAAHCVTSPDPHEKSTLTLVFNPNVHHATQEQLRSIDRVEIPAEWNAAHSPEKDTSDVALVHFSGGLPAGYSPSKLLPTREALTAGENVVLAGYGITNATDQSGAGVLRKTDVHVLNPNYSPSEIQFDQSHGGGACHGDSGGPAYVQHAKQPLLFGITSRGGGNCNLDVVYTKISVYYEWFKEAVKKLRQGEDSLQHKRNPKPKHKPAV